MIKIISGHSILDGWPCDCNNGRVLVNGGWDICGRCDGTGVVNDLPVVPMSESQLPLPLTLGKEA